MAGQCAFSREGAFQPTRERACATKKAFAMTMIQQSVSPTPRALLSLMISVFSVFLVTGAALPAIPLHIHDGLGFSAFAVGIVSGTQFAASLLLRLWAGAVADRRGPKHAVAAGLLMAAGSGFIYVISTTVMDYPVASIAILMVGRALLGGAESFIMTGAQSWCLALAGPGNAGKMIAWIGTAMFLALAIGAPMGSVLYAASGFVAIGFLTLAGAILTLLLVVPIPGVKPTTPRRGLVSEVVGAVWLPGLGMAFAGISYGTMTAFAVLLFVQRGWHPAWLSFTSFAVALIVARVFFGGLPDRLGGARTATIFVLIQSAGMALIWMAPNAWLAFIGSSLAGLGYALVYPGFGMEAIRRAPEEARGLAMGVYTAFIDLSLGFLAPLLGLVASVAGIETIFLLNALLALCAVPIASRLRSSNRLQKRGHSE